MSTLLALITPVNGIIYNKDRSVYHEKLEEI